MSMLTDFLSKAKQQAGHSYKDGPPQLALPPGQALPDSDSDKMNVSPKNMMQNKILPKDAITGDDGFLSTDQTNPFLDAIRKSRQNNNTGPGVLKQFFDGLMTDPKSIKDQGGLSAPQITPADISRGPDLAAPPQTGDSIPQTPLPVPRPPAADYSMPTAIDPNSIEQLRQSLLTDAGQRDPNNPNGLAGRMASPNAPADMGQQQNQSMSIEDAIRGFDGGPKPLNPGFTANTAPTGDITSSLPDLSAMLSSMI